MGTDADNVRMFRTGTHPCGYWADRQARDLVLDPHDPRLPQLYPMALDWGFRRSGDIVYRPSCVGCQACVAVRVPVAGFRPDRSQRRCLKRNGDVDARIVASVRTGEHLGLYRKYLAARHPGGGMTEMEIRDYAGMVDASHGRVIVVCAIVQSSERVNP